MTKEIFFGSKNREQNETGFIEQTIILHYPFKLLPSMCEQQTKVDSNKKTINKMFK